MINIDPPDIEDKAYSDFPIETINSLNTVFQQNYQKSGLPFGISMTVISNNGAIWKSTVGYMDRKKLIPATDNSMFYSGSTAKLSTSAIIFSLIEEGSLSLDDTVTKWLPGYEELENVTVENLLTHQSGIVNFVLINTYINERTRYWSEKELADLALLTQDGLLFEPGTAYHYSNTGYIFLGLIAKEVSGKTMPQLFNEKIRQKCGLTHSFYMTEHNTFIGYLDGFDKNGRYISEDHYNSEYPANPHAAGSYCITSYEWAVFLHSLLSGSIISKDTLKLLFSNLSSLGSNSQIEAYYGRGITLLRIDNNGRQSSYIGHDGFLAGHTVRLFHCIDIGLTISITTNQDCQIDPIMFSLEKFFAEADK